MHSWCTPGERSITLLTAGNLATTQAVVSMLDERAKAPDDRHPSILVAPSMFQVARLVGEILREEIQANAATGQKADSAFNSTIVVGGQIKGSEPRLFMIYPEGNFIEASPETPFFQIGETKYGRPILVRVYDPDMSFEDATKLMMVSFDSTIKANLSVGLPLDLLVYENDKFEPSYEQRIDMDDNYFSLISNGWGDALKKAFFSLPKFNF
ncbi:MAG: peptidase [Sneathiella sp.]|nr:MAG: peptidase [Sneathiella sp.]